MWVTTTDGSRFEIKDSYKSTAPSGVSKHGWYMTEDSNEHGYTWIAGRDIVRIEYVPAPVAA